MIETPAQTESNNNTSSNKKNISENSDNNIEIDYSLPKLPLPNIKIEEDNLSSGTDEQFYPIHNSILSDNLEELEKLLKLGENPDLLNKSGETALYLSVDIENYDALIILLEFGADCNVQKEDGNTPLHLAAEKKLDIYACSLLSHGANPNITNKTNLQSPMHIAIINKMNEYVLNKFKENNGDIYNIKDKFNKSPLDYAINDEKYKNLLISIFTKNKLKENNYNNKNRSLNGNSESSSNLDYYNFISLSRNIQIADDNKDGINNINNIGADQNQNKETENNNINDINNYLKKHLIFSSNSKEISSDQKQNKLIFSSSGVTNSSGMNNNSNRNDTNNNIINIISDKNSNISNNKSSKNNSLNNNNNIINTNHNSDGINDNNNLTENNIKLTNETKSINYMIMKNLNTVNNTNTDMNMTFPNEIRNKQTSHSFSLYTKKPTSMFKINNLKNLKAQISNNILNIDTNTNNTNGNISNSSYNNRRKEEGISELNPLDMINQMGSSNNSNIFSELQINSKTLKEGESSPNKNQQTEEEFYSDENNKKILSNDELNIVRENISGNFSINNNESSNKKEINYINSLDDSLEYSKSKSYIINETSGLNSKNKNDNSDISNINIKDESLNILNKNDDNKNIERYKSSTSNKSKSNIDYDMDSEHSNLKSSSGNYQIENPHRQLSYHNNRHSSSNKNNQYNINSNNNNINDNFLNDKENIEPNRTEIINTDKNILNITNDNNINYTFSLNNKSNNSIKNLKNQINRKIGLLNQKKCDIIHQDMNQTSFPLYTVVSKKKIYKSKSKLPDRAKEQKTKDSILEEYKLNDKINNEENIIFMNDSSHYNYNVNEGFGNIYNNTSNNPFNTFYSDNNSSKNDTLKYNHLFRKVQKKKFLTKEFLNSTLNNSKNKSSIFSDDAKYKENSENKYPDIIHPQQISNELISKLREWLISCDLLCYYNLLIKNNIYDIEAYITNLKNNKINISFKDIEDLGIKKPGHIFRFLLKVQMDIGVLDNKICNYILGKYNENILSTIGVNISINEIRYCGMILCPTSNDITRNTNYSDIFSFLRKKELMEFKENFVHNGFDQIDFILIQLFSCFAFNKEILNDYFHIYSDSDQNKVIKKLYEEKEMISKEIGIDYDEKEAYNIINEQFNDIGNFHKSKDDNICNIF